MTFTTRAQWGARPPRSIHRIATPTPIVYLHHAAGALDAGGNGVWWDDVRGIQNFHMGPQRGWSDIAYSFLIGGGEVFEGRGVGIAGGHTSGQNTVSHAICLIGDYTWMEPSDADLEAIAQLYTQGIRDGWWLERIEAHRDAPGAKTSCCGDKLVAKLPWIRERARQINTPTPDGDDEMALAKYMTKGLAMQRLEQVCRKHRDADMSITDRRWLEADTDARIAKGEPIDPLIDWWDAALYAEGQ